MDNQKLEELQRTICRLSKDNARLYEAYFQESKRVNEVSEQNSKQLKRVDELEKILAKYDNHQIMLINERDKLLREKETMEKRLQDRDREVKNAKKFAKFRALKDRKNNAELCDARAEFIKVFSALASSSELEKMEIGIKRVGNLDFMPFLEAMEREGFKKQDAVYMASKLCAKWEACIRRQSWCPFKIDIVQGKPVEIIDGDDADLKALLFELGEQVYKTVTTALTERKEYNANGQRNVVQELWNFKENRKASLKEGIAFAAERYLKKTVCDRPS